MTIEGKVNLKTRKTNETLRTAGVAEVQNILYSIIPTYGPVGIVITNMAS